MHQLHQLKRWTGSWDSPMNSLVKGSGWFIKGWGARGEWGARAWKNITRGALCCWLLIDVFLPCGILLFLTVAPAPGVFSGMSGATRHVDRGCGWEEQLSALTRPWTGRPVSRRCPGRPEQPLGLRKAPGYVNNDLMRMHAITVISKAHVKHCQEFQEGLASHRAGRHALTADPPATSPKQRKDIVKNTVAIKRWQHANSSSQKCIHPYCVTAVLLSWKMCKIFNWICFKFFSFHKKSCSLEVFWNFYRRNIKITLISNLSLRNKNGIKLRWYEFQYFHYI